ncbi:MAG: hypothetical protein BMS9Abin26_0590 [Gammaproteobacteria bacterium]|nr:MAG: hypothetical protein BMS9Abin26_0590 [Gammaproteobacteria bacterium]
MNTSVKLIYMLGFEGRTLDEFISLLDNSGIRILVDIRSQPVSRMYPDFSMDNIRERFGQVGGVYHWAGRQLGEQRQQDEKSINTSLDDPQLRGFADFMQTEGFKRGMTNLVNLADKGLAGVLSEPRLAKNTQRELMADYLMLQGMHVLHLTDPGEACEHQLDPRARRESVELVYDQ